MISSKWATTLPPDGSFTLFILDAIALDTNSDGELAAQKQDHLAKCKRQLDAARFLFKEGEMGQDEYVKCKEQFEQEIAHWEAIIPESENNTQSFQIAAETMSKLAHTWAVASDEDKQIMVRSLFEAVYYDLENKQIIDFRLKPWADNYLIARVALLESEITTKEDRKIAPLSHFKGWHDLCP